MCSRVFSSLARPKDASSLTRGVCSVYRSVSSGPGAPPNICARLLSFYYPLGLIKPGFTVVLFTRHFELVSLFTTDILGFPILFIWFLEDTRVPATEYATRQASRQPRRRVVFEFGVLVRRHVQDDARNISVAFSISPLLF